jgi:hypothetical protein
MTAHRRHKPSPYRPMLATVASRLLATGIFPHHAERLIRAIDQCHDLGPTKRLSGIDRALQVHCKISCNLNRASSSNRVT